MRRPFLDLDDAVVVITGASSGVGRATAERLATRGSRLVLAARGEQALADTARACSDIGADVLAVPTDVADLDETEALANAATRRFGRIDAWINNAGVMAYGRFDDVPVASHRRVIETNLMGAVHGSAHAIRAFRDRGRGVLVMVASLYAEMTTPFVSAYVASKSGLLGLSRALRRDLWPDDDIEVCCILPSSLDTPIFANAANYAGREVRAIPPVASPERVARAIVASLERPRREVRVGWLGRIAAQGENLARPVYDRVINRSFSLAAFRRAERSRDDGNLFEPKLGQGRIDGGWRRTGLRRVVAGLGVAAAGAALKAAGRSRVSR